MKQMINKVMVVALLGLMLMGCVSTDFSERVPSVERTQYMEHGDDWRNLRYGEVIPVWKSGTRLYMEVYNTVNLNELPWELWEKLDADILEEAYGAEKVILNGPRYWLVNDISGNDVNFDGLKFADFGGIEMFKAATLENSIFSGAVGSKLYSDKTVNRNTTFSFWKGNMVYELTNDKGERYRMQAYSQMIDKNLTIDDLEHLGEKLDLPEGWSYSAFVLDEDDDLIANGTATIINDEFASTYQKIED